MMGQRRIYQLLRLQNMEIKETFIQHSVPEREQLVPKQIPS
jgi:hypothetical protein